MPYKQQRNRKGLTTKVIKNIQKPNNYKVPRPFVALDFYCFTSLDLRASLPMSERSPKRARQAEPEKLGSCKRFFSFWALTTKNQGFYTKTSTYCQIGYGMIDSGAQGLGFWENVRLWGLNDLFPWVSEGPNIVANSGDEVWI